MERRPKPESEPEPTGLGLNQTWTEPEPIGSVSDPAVMVRGPVSAPTIEK